MENHNYVDSRFDGEDKSDFLLKLLNRIQKITHYPNTAYDLLCPSLDINLPTEEDVDNTMAILTMGSEAINGVINDLYKLKDLLDKPTPRPLPEIKFVPTESSNPVHPRPVDLNALVGTAKQSSKYDTREALAQIRACMDPTSYSSSKDQLYYIKSVLDQTKDLDSMHDPKDES